MDKSAFQLLKNNFRTNEIARLHDTPIINYGRVIKVIDIQTVIVESVIQTSLSREVHTVTLLNLSSALLEINAYPKLGDSVLLLFLQRYDPRMFVQDSVRNPNATGYNRFSGVGVLASTVKGSASTVIHHFETEGKPVTEIKGLAKIFGTFNAELAVTFCRAVFDSEDEALINMVFGEGRPYMAQFLSRVERRYGFWDDNEGSLQELDAAVTERYSRYAPVTKDIQGTQTYTVGIDRDGSSTEAPVSFTLGEDADVYFDSRSGMAASIAKDVDLLIGGNETRNVGGDKEEAVAGKAKYGSADTDIESTAPIGLNDGLYRTGLRPYLDAETAAHEALRQAAAQAAPQLAILDAMSGGTGFITGLGAAVVAFCEAAAAADTAAHASISKAVK